MRNVLQMIMSILFLSTAPISYASDLEKETRWAEQVVDAIFDGEAIQLKDKELSFLAIYSPSITNNTDDAAIILHGLGVHPDWDQVIRPLRTNLPEKGWATLSLQMPILANGIGYKEYAPLFIEVPGRIEAGVNYLKQQGAKRIVIISHSLGAAMGAYYLAKSQTENIAGFVGIGMSGGEHFPEMDNVALLKSIHIPVLDIYGEYDLSSVLSSAVARKHSLNNRNMPVPANNSTQTKVPGADHFFNDQDGRLIKNITRWLTDL